MNIRCKLLLSAIALSGVIHNAFAQGRPDPADPGLKSPKIESVSPFATYQRYEDEKPASWRALNDQVRGLGGHAGHIKDGASGAAQPAASPGQPITAPSPAPAPSQPAVSPGHSNHKH